MIVFAGRAHITNLITLLNVLDLQYVHFPYCTLQWCDAQIHL